MGELNREELAAMTDQELLAYEREHHGDPYMTLLRAQGMQRVALQLWHVGATWKKADRAAQAEARRRLLQKLLPSDSAVVVESDDQKVRAPHGLEIPPPVIDVDDELVVSTPDDADDIIDHLLDATEGIDAMREIDCEDKEQDR